MSTPEISVVIPTRDRWPRLSSCGLASALQQRDVDVEVIVVDDGSTDETARELAKLTDPRLRVLRHDTPRGVSRARNTGIRAARGEWLAFLDDDDLWSPWKLHEQLEVARSQHASLVYCAAVFVDDDRAVTGVASFPDPADISTRLLVANVVPGGCSGVIARTRLVRDVGCFDERLWILADWDLWIRLTETGHAAACPDVLTGYAVHSANMTVERIQGIIGEFEYLAEKHRARALALGVEIDREQMLRWVARQERRGLSYAVQAERRAGRRLRAIALSLRAAFRYRSPDDVFRAVGIALGERSIRIGARLRRRPRSAELVAHEPAWLDLYR